MLLLFTYITYLLTIYFLHPLTVSSVTGVVIRAPTSEHATHLLQLRTGVKTSSREFDLDLHSHTAIPLYAYDAGHPLELLTRVGHWKECVVVSRAPGTNQFVVRMGPAGHQFWALLLPWNHRSLSYHVAIPLFAVYVRAIPRTAALHAYSHPACLRIVITRRARRAIGATRATSKR